MRTAALKLDVLRQFPATERYLVGVSGGRDSMTLLHLLASRGYKKLIVCHLNHALRGRSSDADERFVARAAERFGFQYAMQRIDVKKIAARDKVSIELAGRRERHRFFAECARKHRTQTVFLGHHADDLVETLLMNLFRGTSPSSLLSLRETHPVAVGRAKLTLVRPLLRNWRNEIEAFVRQKRIAFRQDATNSSLDATRNRIRHRIIPYLERTMSRDIRKSLWRFAMIVAEEQSLIETPPAASTLSARDLAKLPVALQRRMIAEFLRCNCISDIGFDLVEQVRAIAESSSRTAKANLPGARHARRRAGKLFIE